MSTFFRPFAAVFTVLLLLAASAVQAHEPEHSYLFLRVYESGIEGRFEVAPIDLNHDLRLNLSEEIDSVEVAKYADQISAYMGRMVQFSSSAGNFPLAISGIETMPLDDEPDQIALHFTLEGVSAIPDNLNISYKPFFEKAPNHTGVLIIEHNWKAGIIDNHLGIAATFTENDTEETLDLTDGSLFSGFWAMTKLGMWHIWIGLDHILFLVALILPSVVRRRRQSQLDPDPRVWKPVDAFRPAFMYLLGIITSFTVAHSITLAVAAVGWIDLPGRYVESIIAFSIALAAFHNIRPIFKGREWFITFAFGLFHGFGFASVLGEKGLSGEFMALSLVGFNVGVEIGQVLIVAGIFPILYLIRKTKAYPKIILFGSWLLIVIALHWVVERLFEIDIRLGSFLDSFL